jgi:Na+-driven multidrug efflux pump
VVEVMEGKHRNVFVVAAVILLTTALIIGISLLIFGEYLIPLVLDTAPYSYLTVLVVVLAAFFFAM